MCPKNKKATKRLEQSLMAGLEWMHDGTKLSDLLLSNADEWKKCCARLSQKTNQITRKSIRRVKLNEKITTR